MMTDSVSRSKEILLILILSLGGAAAVLDGQALYYLSPFLSRDLHLNNSQIGLVSSIKLLPWAVSAILVGRLSDRSGKRKQYLVVVFAMIALSSVLSGLASSFMLLLVARLVMGIADGPRMPLSSAIMLAGSLPGRRGFNVGIVQNFGAQLVGSMLGPIIVVKLATSYDWRMAFYIAAVPSILVSILIAMYVRDPVVTAPIYTDSQPDIPSKLSKILAHRNVRVCIVLSILVSAWYFLLLTFLPLYCVRVLGLTPARMSYVMAANGAAGVVSSILVPFISDRIGRKPILIFVLAASVLGPAAPLLLGSSFGLLLCLVFFGSFGIGTTPLIFGVVPFETVSPRDSAAASALVLGTGAVLGGFLGAALAGVLSDRYGLSLPLYMGMIAASVATASCYWLRETAPRVNFKLAPR